MVKLITIPVVKALLTMSFLLLLQRVMPSCWFLLLRFWVSLQDVYLKNADYFSCLIWSRFLLLCVAPKKKIIIGFPWLPLFFLLVAGLSIIQLQYGVSSHWFMFLLQLRVDGVLMRLRDTRMYCAFGADIAKPVILRETCWREATFKGLSAVSSCIPLITIAFYFSSFRNYSVRYLGIGIVCSL